MTENGTDPDSLPNGEGDGNTSDNAADTTSGGAPDQPDSPSDKEDADGTPVENPAG